MSHYIAWLHTHLCPRTPGKTYFGLPLVLFLNFSLYEYSSIVGMIVYKFSKPTVRIFVSRRRRSSGWCGCSLVCSSLRCSSLILMEARIGRGRDWGEGRVGRGSNHLIAILKSPQEIVQVVDQLTSVWSDNKQQRLQSASGQCKSCFSSASQGFI